MNIERRKLIPIIGTISSGKSTFLKALLGTNVLQVGSTTTTKFVCLIKNSEDIKFYKVNLSRDNEQLNFVKGDEEIIGEENIKNKIAEINNDLKNLTKASSDEEKRNIFYMLETPIKNIENQQLLDECYFMDIPGLNENENPYIETIFSLVQINDIKFEIMIFDCSSIGGNGVFNIFKNIKKNNCLKKSGNLFILNKIDLTSQEKENIIRSFNQYFYNTFGTYNIQNSSSDTIFIEQSKNCSIPMNSIKFLAETRSEDDFCSLLKFEYFNFLENNVNSFFEYINRKIKLISNYEEIQSNLDLDSVSKKDMKYINEVIEEVSKISKAKAKLMDLDLDEEEHENLIKELFLIHKKKQYDVLTHSPSYIAINKFFDNYEDVSTENEANSLPQKKVDGAIIYKLDKCLQATLGIIDRENELIYFRRQLAALKEYITNRKLRIVFIGNISVGKSSVINTIIGKEILPTQEGECTYRGVIIRHEDIDEYNLYSTRLVEKGEGFDKFSFFDTENWICKGIQNIKEQLTNKNNDKIDINKNDAFFLITGKLKIFEYININKNIIEEIEFVDLPGADKDENDFNKKGYNNNVLTFSNCCIYVNASSSVNDENSVKNIKYQYNLDRDKIFITLRSKFIKTCLFLMNKSDELGNGDKGVEQEKEENNNSLYNIINDSEENLDINDLIICYFSGKYYMKYLEIKEKYVNLLEDNPLELMKELKNNYIAQTPENSFEKFIQDNISKIKLDFELKEDFRARKNEIIPLEFETKLKDVFLNLNIKLKKTKEVIKNLYILKETLKNKDYSNSKYFSNELYKTIQKIIITSLELRRDNFKESLKNYLTYADILFDKKIEENPFKKEMEKTKKYSEMYQIIEYIEKILREREEKLMNIMTMGTNEILNLIDDEINNISDRLKESQNDVLKAKDKLIDKINQKINDIKIKREKEIKELNNEIKAAVFAIEKLQEESYENENDKIIDKNEINIDDSIPTFIKSLMNKMEEMAKKDSNIGNAIITSAIASGLMGIGIYIGVAILIEITKFFAKLFFNHKSEKYYKEGLLKYRGKMMKTLNEYKNNRKSDFTAYKESFLSSMNIKLEMAKKDISISALDEKETWKKLKEEYQKIKDDYDNEVIPFLDEK